LVIFHRPALERFAIRKLGGFLRLPIENPDSAVEREVVSVEQTFRSKDMLFGIANGKSQISKYGICNLPSEIASASEDSMLQARSALTF
jgi:hypothetical protein